MLGVIAIGIISLVGVVFWGISSNRGGNSERLDDSSKKSEIVSEKIAMETTSTPTATMEVTPTPTQLPSPKTVLMNSDYVFPDSSNRYLTAEEINGLDLCHMYIARNEICAREGRIFVNEDLRQYFGSKSWYSPVYQPEEFDEKSDTLLNDFEKENMKAIRSVEEQLGSPYLKTYAPFYGVWCFASGDQFLAQDKADDISQSGWRGQVFSTGNWSNLNGEILYVVTAGVYLSESDANAVLTDIQSVYPDAYVKYSGEWQATEEPDNGDINIQNSKDKFKSSVDYIELELLGMHKNDIENLFGAPIREEDWYIFEYAAPDLFDGSGKLSISYNEAHVHYISWITEGSEIYSAETAIDYLDEIYGMHVVGDNDVPYWDFWGKNNGRSACEISLVVNPGTKGYVINWTAGQ